MGMWLIEEPFRLEFSVGEEAKQAGQAWRLLQQQTAPRAEVLCLAEGCGGEGGRLGVYLSVSRHVKGH